MVTSAQRCSCLQTAKGDISLWSLALWWPYHLGLRTKLKIQRHTRTEPTWSSIAPGWCAVNARLLEVMAGSYAGCPCSSATKCGGGRVAGSATSQQAPCCATCGSEPSDGVSNQNPCYDHTTTLLCRWLGGWCSTDQELPEGHPAVLDCTCELPLLVRGSPYLNLPTWDTYGARWATMSRAPMSAAA